MNEAWDKLDNLETAYHDMLMKVHRLQSNRVCIGLLTGEDYPGEEHPEVCPCADNKEKEEADQRKQEEREREEERKKQEEAERKAMEKERRERILEMRKKRFYSRMHDGVGLVRFKDQVQEEKRKHSEESEEEESSEEGEQTSGRSLKAPISSAERQQLEEQLREDQRRRELLFKTGLNDLTRLDASRRRRSSRAAIDDVLDPIRISRGGVGGGMSLLTRLMQKAEGRPMDLIVMDGEVKKMEYKFQEDGSMFHMEERVKSFELEEGEEEVEKEETELELEMEEEEEEELALDFTEDEVVHEEPEEEEEAEEKVPFGDFLDMMEVF